jgi:hypothetical protein
VRTKTVSLIWLFSALLIMQACGYHNPYTGSRYQEQADVAVYISVWDNRTNEMGLENLIFQKTADWLRQINFLRITTDQARADYLLSGTVLEVDYPASAFSATSTATTLNARIQVEYRLIERTSGKTLWQTTETIRSSGYPVGADAIRTQSNKNPALETIATEVGEKIYLRLTDTLTTTNGSEEVPKVN